MPSSIICVYQDCPLCGAKGQKLKEIMSERDIRTLHKISFASPEGKELCAKAVFEHGIKTMPFFTDGVNFSARLEDLTKTVEKCEKTTKNNRKNVKNNKKAYTKRVPKAKKRVQSVKEDNGLDQ